MIQIIHFFVVVCLFFIIDAIADDTVRYQYVKKKGYVRLHTNKGDLNIELHCDKVKTCTFRNVEQTTKELSVLEGD